MPVDADTPMPAPGGRAVIGVDIGGTKIAVALASGPGAVLREVRLPTLAARGPDQALRRVGEAVRHLTDEAAGLGLTVVGRAAVVPGVVRPRGLLLAPNLPGWEDLALSRRLGEALGTDSIPVWNDVRAGAFAELRYGNLRGADPGLYLSLGTGVAAAVTVGGTVLEGAHGAAGEMAYVTTEAGPSTSTHAPLESVVGGKALGERASQLLGEDIDAAALFRRGDPEAQQIVHHALGVLASAVANIAAVLDPVRVVVGGGMMGSAAPILAVVRAQVRRAVPFPPDVVAARFVQDASLHGALALAAATDAPAQTPRSDEPERPACAPASHRPHPPARRASDVA
jgi:glucokinase